MDPIHLLAVEVRGFLFLLAAVLIYKGLTGGVALRGLLSRKGDTGQTSPERIQLLLATLALGAKYLGEVAHGSGGVMPDVSAQWLYVFGGSSGVYASVKAFSVLRKR